MAKSGSGGGWAFIAAGLILAAGGVGYLAYQSAQSTHRPIARPATLASTRSDEAVAASKPAPAPQPTTTFIDVIRASHPHYSTSQALPTPLRELGDGARIILRDPVYMGPAYRADLWITRTDGLPMDEALRRAMDRKAFPQVHVVSERVRFVQWDDEQVPSPHLVCEGSDGQFSIVSLSGRKAIGAKRKYDWPRALKWNDKVIVPSEAGVSVFRFYPELTEAYQPLLNAKDAEGRPAESRPQALLDFQGLIAWAPPDGTRPGSRGAARFVDDKWTTLTPEQGWPEQLLHLVPLLDGSVLQIIAGADDAVSMKLATLYVTEVSEEAVSALVEQMSDADAEKRELAFKDLSKFGPGLYPILEKLAADQPPEARARLRALMRNQVRPTLGGMTLLGDKLTTVTRQSDGSVLFHAEAGVAIPRPDGSEPFRRAPAWLSVRPGYAATTLDPMMIKELRPNGCELVTTAGEWIAFGDAAGPRRWVGTEFMPLLRKSDQAFSKFEGIDRRGRWLFQKPDGSETLIIDPNLPDPTPRLPFWEHASSRAQGWDANDWPTVRRDGGDWALHEDRWELLREKKGERMLTEMPPTSQPTTRPTTKAATTQDATNADVPLLIDAEGTCYFDGKNAIRLVTKDQKEVIWPLPASATGTGKPTLLRTADGILYLFNQPGRILRIRPTPSETEPFTIEATFTKRIPSVDQPKRIWLDPAGRICLVDARRLIIFFPQGYIPQPIRDMMPLNPDEFEE